ncbi:MAG TPA: response regulator [Bryobacteraceae bacterium]|nr:response regulator [Bryobacteraceae bacterium]
MLNILIVEDNEGDVLLVKEALREHRIEFEIKHLFDGEQALAYLNNAVISGSNAPDLVLLDLNLPKRDGWEVLQVLRRSPDLKATPVVIFSSSNAPEDLRRAAGMDSLIYIRKPSNLEEFLAIGKRIESFWLSCRPS